MSRVLVTGSTDGIGAAVSTRLEAEGHTVLRHARSAERAREAGVPDALVGDLMSLESTAALGRSVREAALDAVVHNAGWASPHDVRETTVDGVERTFAVHVLAPYVLSAVAGVPARWVYVSSDSIRGASVDLDDLQLERGWTSATAYSSSKLAGTALTFALARRVPGALVNAVHPGWVRTKMSGDVAPLSVEQGADTPAWLAVSDDPEALTTGRLFQDRAVVRLNDAVDDEALQERVVETCERLSGLRLA
ncbi:NAD(P)-dependent dehydrogenase (short-subunit alcohol dehydrogenase family) [Motilibacter peucedani]|uniref:NAD(P)-dependent dehydrogenase (Short-subunit alcohol dehydrogenase family) n=1 Tax=Motilibacter peucedani TaxID=598650 RepID=A0A420XTN9_9ACTN|nr:SDR family NAD(P)-dependent oxidoreductase [Motilibacter peucedani]RKS80184.1 NAD(P)-dependent dehydrogenase (short-subunit alcohol dehydrogenase family) [Motilibacter peucedani]